MTVGQNLQRMHSNWLHLVKIVFAAALPILARCERMEDRVYIR